VEPFAWYLGIDWGSATHEFCLGRADGRIVGTRTVTHSAADVHAAFQWVCQQTGAAPEAVAVAIETRSGTLVETALDLGFAVFTLNPKQLDRFRDRFSAAGAKDDARDARVLEDALRTDRRAFRRVQPEDPTVLQLRELTRLVDDLQVEERRLANRLRQQLYRVDAAWLTVSPAADEPWLWTILAKTPHPAAWATLSARHIGGILRRHRIRRLQPAALVEGLRQPRLGVAAGVPDAVALRVASLVPQLRLVHEQGVRSARQIAQLLDTLAGPDDGEPHEHRDVEILQSLPGAGRMVTATMLAEASGPLAARDYATLRAYAGAAPVTKRSGKRQLVHMRYACHPRLRNALYHWARTSIQHDPAARAYYAALRARGHQHGRALRSVADRWLRILIAMLSSRTLYDPGRPLHGASAA
jgi:transposase